MSEFPAVRITRVDRTVLDIPEPTVHLGSHELSEGVTRILRRLSADADELYLLEWEGNKIPRGAVINGHTIAWTQNGQVTTTERANIGTYTRLAEFGGLSGKEQKIVVFVFPEYRS